MKSIFKNQKGIALLMVLSTIAVLTVAMVELATNSRINYRMAVHNKERVQAFYLAKSALNLSKLILKYNKQAEKMLSQATEKGVDLKVEPLYRMIPLSSELLRGMISMGGGEEGGEAPEEGESEEEAAPEEPPAEGEEATGEDEGEEGSTEEDLLSGISTINKEEAEKFLSFEGDFSSEITEEQNKFDLNKIYNIETTSAAYDSRKKLLWSILQLPKFKEIIEEGERGAETIAHALSDWVDPNGVINEFENIQRGSEGGIYTDVRYEVKNGKYLSLSEMRLVAGVNDVLFEALAPLVTVYGGSDKINPCLAEEDLVMALVHHYSNHSGCVTPIPYGDTEKLKELVSAVTAACPDVASGATALNDALGVGDIAEEGKGGTGNVAGCAFQFKDLVTEDNKVFMVKGTGTVGETEVSVTMVLNTAENDPMQWKTYYYRID